jgi:hypothetical protein
MWCYCKMYPRQNVPYQNVSDFSRNVPNHDQNVPNQNLHLWSKCTHNVQAVYGLMKRVLRVNVSVLYLAKTYLLLGIVAVSCTSQIRYKHTF